MKKLPSILALGCFLLAPAFASATVDTSVSFSYGMADSRFDANGDKKDLHEFFGVPEDSDINASFMIIGIGAGYEVMDGLKVNLDLPIVQKAFKLEAGGQVVQDDSAFGLGDPTIGATYMHSINDTLAVGGGLDVKLSLGESEQNLANTTDEALHITAKGMVSATPVDNLGVDLDLGYIVALGGPNVAIAEGVTADLDHGDILFANLYLGYSIEGITPRLGVHYSQTGAITYAEDVSAAGISSGDEIEDTDKNRMSLSFAVDYDIDDSMSVTAGIGTNSIHEGTNLPYGYALTGKNYSAGFAFGLGFNASF